MTEPMLDNVLWRSLTGLHAAFTTGTKAAGRLVKGFPPVLAFESLVKPDFTDLEAHREAGEHFYRFAWRGPAASGWRIDAEVGVHAMIWIGAAPEPDDEAVSAVRLEKCHVPQMLELVAPTNPRPFSARSIEFGAYFGVFEDERLVAMAGEGFAAGSMVHPGRAK